MCYELQLKSEEFLKDSENIYGEKITDFIAEGGILFKMIINAMDSYAKYCVNKEINKSADQIKSEKL